MTKAELIKELEKYPDDIIVCEYSYVSGIHIAIDDVYEDAFNDPTNATGTNLHGKQVLVLA